MPHGIMSSAEVVRQLLPELEARAAYFRKLEVGAGQSDDRTMERWAKGRAEAFEEIYDWICVQKQQPTKYAEVKNG